MNLTFHQVTLTLCQVSLSNPNPNLQFRDTEFDLFDLDLVTLTQFQDTEFDVFDNDLVILTYGHLTCC